MVSTEPLFDKDASFKSALLAELVKISNNLQNVNRHLESIAESLAQIEHRDASKPKPVQGA